MGTPVRFPFGVVNADKTTPFGNYKAMSPLVFHEDFDDFKRFAAAEWTITRVGTTPTEALTDGNGGLLLLTTVASALSSTFLQKVGASFLPTSGKQLWFATRMLVSSASDTSFAVGLQLTDTTPQDATDGIYFIKAAAATTVDLVCRKNATTGSISKTAVATLADSTFVDLAYYYDGKRTIHIYVNGVNVYDLDLTATPTDYLPDTVLRVSFGVANGASTARTAQYDYLYASIER